MVRRDAVHGGAGGGAVREQTTMYNPFRPVRRVGIRAEIALVDADAKSNASASAGPTAEPSEPVQTVDGRTGNPQTFATLERNTWILDGNHEMVTENTSDIGWWSLAASGEDGVFAGECYIEYRFSEEARTVGLVLHFVPGYQPAVGGMRIRTYDADDVLVTDVYNTVTTPEQQVEFSAIYTRMRIDFYKTALPGRRIRMTELDFGVTQRFDADSIAGAEIRYKTDLASAALPYGQCRITIDNADRKYNLLNPSGIYQYLEEGQKVSVWLTLDGEDVYMGAWSFASAEARDSALTAQITAVDVIASLDESEYNGGRCAAAQFSDAIAEVLGDADIECIYDAGVAETSVMMSVPQKTSRREAVRMLAQAAMACVYADRAGRLRFCRPAPGMGDEFYIDDEGVLRYSETEDFVLGDDGVLYSPGGGIAGILVGDTIIKTDWRMTLTKNELYDYDGITVSESVGRVELVVNDEYSETEIVYTAGDSGKIKSVKNPCVASENGTAVAEWLLDKYSRSKVYSVRNRCNPAAELTDTVRIEDAYGQNDLALVTGITVTYNGGITATTEAQG